MRRIMFYTHPSLALSELFLPSQFPNSSFRTRCLYSELCFAPRKVVVSFSVRVIFSSLSRLLPVTISSPTSPSNHLLYDTSSIFCWRGEKSVNVLRAQTGHESQSKKQLMKVEIMSLFIYFNFPLFPLFHFCIISLVFAIFRLSHFTMLASMSIR